MFTYQPIDATAMAELAFAVKWVFIVAAFVIGLMIYDVSRD